MNTFEFGPQQAVGRWGEEQIAAWLATEYQVTDVSADRTYQEQDIDLLLVDGAGQQMGVEVKADTHTTGRVYIEALSSELHGTMGCLLKTGADYVAYYFIRQGRVVLLPVPRLQEWLKKHMTKYKQRRLLSVYRGRELPSVGYAIPERHLLRGVKGALLYGGLPVYQEGN